MQAFHSRWQRHLVETNNIRLHCITQGEGELVVLLHGFFEFWYSWRYQIPFLARHFRVVVPDLRGYNNSDKPATGYDLDTLSADICGLIDSLGYARAHVVGHDWGGAIAWHLGQYFPESLQSLTLLNAPHPQRFLQSLPLDIDRSLRSWPVFAMQVPFVSEWMLRLNLQQFVQNLFRSLAVRKGEFGSENTKIYQAALAKPGAIAAIATHCRQFFSPQSWLQQWGQAPAPVSVPTLVLWSEEDALLGHKLLQGIDRLIGAPFQLKFVPQCGHWIQQEAPNTVNRELLDFLRPANRQAAKPKSLPAPMLS